jgi:hypothetical protein
MNQTITLPKSVFEQLVVRLNRLEAMVFGKNIPLSSAAKKRYEKIDTDIAQGKNIHTFDNGDKALTFLLADKR